MAGAPVDRGVNGSELAVESIALTRSRLVGTLNEFRSNTALFF